MALQKIALDEHVDMSKITKLWPMNLQEVDITRHQTFVIRMGLIGSGLEAKWIFTKRGTSASMSFHPSASLCSQEDSMLFINLAGF